MEDAISRGARRFIFVTYENVGWSSFQHREAAFTSFCEGRRLPYSLLRIPWSDEAAKLLDGHTRDISRVLLHESAYERLKSDRQVLSPGRKSAVVCVNDYVAIQVKSAIPAAAVYGFDGVPDAVEMGIVSYRHAMKRMARKSVDLLFRQQTLGENWTARSYFANGTLLSNR